ncbi:MAG: DUF2332 family protein [Desulfobulbus sp.]|jgi:hypothetical protein
MSEQVKQEGAWTARQRLVHRFARQREFAAATSPLSARLLDILGGWLARDDDPLADWLLNASAGRPSFELPLLLLAGLHRAVLLGRPGTQELAAYFPSAGGGSNPEKAEMAAALRTALVACGDELACFLATAMVQTNESARGLCWRVPVLYPGWEAIHLVELGAGAGLNLVADRRPYQLFREADGVRLLDLPAVEEPGAIAVEDPAAEKLTPETPEEPFAVACTGEFVGPEGRHLPQVLSRTGCDLAPLRVGGPEDEATLAAFIWGDQPERLARLHQGLAAFRAEQARGGVHLHRANLPGDLPAFLADSCTPPGTEPLVVYNTYLTNYLPEKAGGLEAALARWAPAQGRPVLWVQWEIPWQGPEASALGWLGWTIDLWQEGVRESRLLGWVHPHGVRVQWLPSLVAWARQWF